MSAGRIIATVIGFVFLLCGTAPLFFFGRLNSGGCALLLFGLLTLALSLFWLVLREHRALRIAGNILAGFLAVCFCAALLLSAWMIRSAYGNAPRAGESGTVVVLGCAVYGDRPSLMLANRLDAAADYLQAHPDAPVIVSGGKGADEPYSEAYVMERYLLDRGIEADRIYREERSTDTGENIAYSAELIRAEELPPALFVVTDGFHQLRAHLHATRLGLTARAIPCKAEIALLPEYWVREILGVLHFTVFIR